MAKKLYTVAVAVAVAEQEHEQTGERQESAALTRGRASERRRQLIQPIYRPLVQPKHAQPMGENAGEPESDQQPTSQGKERSAKLRMTWRHRRSGKSASGGLLFRDKRLRSSFLFAN
jgi:hypothetical protein